MSWRATSLDAKAPLPAVRSGARRMSLAQAVAAYMTVKALGIYLIARLFRLSNREAIDRAIFMAQCERDQQRLELEFAGGIDAGRALFSGRNANSRMDPKHAATVSSG